MVLIEKDIGGDNTNRTHSCILVLDDFYHSINFAYLSLLFRYTCFKQFLDTWQALCDVSLCSCDTTSMESTHCQLSARLTNRLCRDNSRSEEHTSELQSQSNLVCRLLLEKKKESTE